jgi:hypothetical protein
VEQEAEAAIEPSPATAVAVEQTAPEETAASEQVADAVGTPEPMPAEPEVVADENSSADGGAEPATQETAPAVEQVIVQAPEEEAAPVAPAGQAATVKVNRPTTPTEEPEIVAEETGPEELVLEEVPPLERFATAFDKSAGLPLVSILLIDDGSSSDPVGAVLSLGFPATVVLDAMAADATTRMSAYRSAGVELAATITLPDGAVPTDVEVALEAAFGVLPETVALVADEGRFLQSDRALTAQVMEVLAANGRGAVTISRGLGFASRIAEQASVAEVSLLRDLDGAGEDAATINRALEQAAFRARQSGEAVLLARIRPETISALRAWSFGADRDQISLAPLSALLIEEAEVR